jgi:cysteinyl-tRNA synthetase
MLKIFNNLTRTKEVFKPINNNQVNMYVCGVTIYDYCHVGHGRTYVAFDVISRYLKFSGYDVTYVRNITDVDDKIIKRANERNIDPSKVTQEFTLAMYEDFDALGIARPDIEPTVTGHMSEIIEFIEQLIEKGAAYAADNGDVYYHVDSFDSYGKLSKQDLEQLRAGERVEVNTDKRDPLDFVLWKSAKPDEPFWESPWGAGRPGWHIECSAMSRKCFGNHFDIHGGGSDLQFPHHENEIAQSEAANECEYAKYWLHSGMVQVDKEKMSKSLGNFFTIREVLKQYPAEVVRFFLVSSQYRSLLNYSEENLNNAFSALERFYQALKGINISSETIDMNDPFVERFRNAMDDDFNTPEAIAVLFDLTKELNKLADNATDEKQRLANILVTLANLLGFLTDSADRFLQGGDVDVEYIEGLIKERAQARIDRNFARSDEIRDLLLEQGIELQDSRDGTTWKKC